MKLKKGDKIKVMAGKDRGKEGSVDRVWPQLAKVTITGVNIYKRHLKPRAEGQKGSIVDVSKPLPLGNVALICPKCNQPTRIGYKVTATGKVRLCKKCKAEI